MKMLVYLFAVLFCSTFYAQSENTGNTGTITATVPNVQSEEGELLFGLYSEENFMKGAGSYNQIGKIEDGKSTVVFKDVPAGTYAILVLHDLNANKQMDFEANGMPKEDYGTSGNVMEMAPPSWEDSKFKFEGKDRSFEIRF